MGYDVILYVTEDDLGEEATRKDAEIFIKFLTKKLEDKYPNLYITIRYGIDKEEFNVQRETRQDIEDYLYILWFDLIDECFSTGRPR